MAEPILLVERDEGVATLTLNRPAARNSLNRELRVALTRTFRELQRDAAIQVVIVTGAGGAFCAGLDLKELAGMDPGAAGGRAGEDEEVVDAIEAFDRPVIGALNGVAITGGFEIALACDVLIGTPATRFGDTHARVGILPGWGLSQKLSRLVGIGRAKLASLTGNFIDAEEAERWGLLVRVVPADELLATCRSLARDMLSCAPGAARGYKRMIDEGYALPYGEARELERRLSNEHLQNVTGDQVAERRAGITERGRSQKDGQR